MRLADVVTQASDATLLKIDIEGGELDLRDDLVAALGGGLSRVRGLVIELHVNTAHKHELGFELDRAIIAAGWRCIAEGGRLYSLTRYAQRAYERV